MGTTLYTAWYDEVLPDMPGVLQALALNEIRKAAIEFCHKSLVWAVDHDPVSVAATVSNYDFSPPANTQVVQVLQAWFSLRRPVEPKTPKDLAEIYGDWRAAESGEPKFITQTNPTTFYLVPVPNAAVANGLTLRVALKPTRASTGLDSMIWEEYADTITKGAKSRLFLMNKKPWANPQMGQNLEAEFEYECGQARTRVITGLGRATPTVKGSFF
jgi:hypothetical protein